MALFHKKTEMIKHRQIALAFPITVGVYQETVEGILDYSRKRGSWTILCGAETLSMSLSSLKDWAGDGVIATLVSERERRMAQRLGAPVVNLSGALAESGTPRVMNDHEAIGRLAAEHLLECGFCRFAYYGPKQAWHSRERCRGFSARVASEGGSCAVLHAVGLSEKQGTWHRWRRDLEVWLGSLERPFAVMAENDVLARLVAETCRQMGLHVPCDVAVIGVGNNRLLCESSQPTLSSVARNCWEIGWRAAQWLDRLMSGKQPPEEDVLIAPAGVVARQSTDVVAVEDPDLSQAVRYLHDHLDGTFQIRDMVRDLTVSRRWLEYRFRERFHRSPHEYLCQLRVEQAKQLLLEAEPAPVKELARQCGFRRPRTLQRVFQRLTGMTPAQYVRRENAKRSRTAKPASKNRTNPNGDLHAAD